MCWTISRRFRSRSATKSTARKRSRFRRRSRGFEKIEPVYKKLPGWQTSTFGVSEYDKLPQKAKQYLDFVEKESGAKIAIISTGPDREQTIFMPEFVKMLDGISGK